MLDRQGQPLARGFNAKLRSGRGIDELIGLCKGLIGDGVVNQTEIEFLLSWLSSNQEIAAQWPANVLYERIERVLEDGLMDTEEEGEVLALLAKVVGGNASEFGESSFSTRLPLDDPRPSIVVNGRRFCFTGKFVIGSRNYCSEQVVSRGGQVIDSIVKDMDYLVLGMVGSRDWKHSTHGTKILKAIAYRDGGSSVKIVDEEHFAHELGLGAK